ncbi:hypothetical protein SEA_SPEEDDEMON_1450 [Gordonia phage SpeedDemon]|uniref:Uncharacterized protein n=1 Tax=Gordonia phage Bantam TaxID=1887641 RepID=A0A1B3AYL5_9CAUD|nr:hypothetical protein BIZ77_gp033 [Gordonia phage Bantam]AOE43835.1 hypothetical protein SEA_BANTAM_146 [Gordonia phage Bantam]QNL30595.1 hypothetical protein SEA_SPEEDDEMON_1450 [Gordonia phage SpeedDemon]
MKVRLQWVEDEVLSTRYEAELEVPADFATWDADVQEEFLDGLRFEHDFSGLEGETVTGEVTGSEIEEWSVLTPAGQEN